MPLRHGQQPPRRSAGAASRSERARRSGVLSVEAQAARAWAGLPERWGRYKNPETAWAAKVRFPSAFYKKVGLFRKEARKWGEVQVLRAQWGLGPASPVTGRGHVQKPPQGLAHPLQEELAAWRGLRLGTSLALSLKDTSEALARPQLREYLQAAAPPRLPSSNQRKRG